MNHLLAATARRAGIIAVAAVSVLAGGAALWGQLNPDSLADARTVDLLMVLALLVLPAATCAGLILERRHRAVARRTSLVETPASLEPAKAIACPPAQPARETTSAARSHPGAAVARRDRLAAHAVRRQDVRPTKADPPPRAR